MKISSGMQLILCMTEVPNVLPMGGRVECPESKKLVHVGTGGHKNLDVHRLSEVVSRSIFQGILYSTPKLNYSLHKFFKPQVSLKSLRGFDPTSRPPTQNLEPFVQNFRAPWRKSKQNSVKEAFNFFKNFEAAANQIPNDVPIAIPQHCLVVFAANPRACVAKPRPGRRTGQS
jgi:hypothetical protein